MTPDRWRQIDRVFEAALEQPPSRRAAFLEEACGADAELRREVAQLLAAGAEADAFFETPPASAVADAFDASAATSLAGSAVGPYHLLRELGRGGMGMVWLATRADDQYRRQVAIKLLWPGPNNAEVLRRFRRERQILANLHHPNIAHMHDGGTTEDGRPYFVMEYVAGAPITEYCRTRRLPLPERLRLLQQVCAAVQYAHRNLIIHRDLKPGNILVTEAGEVKLLDFGIARVLDPALHGLTAGPATQALLLTPEYASPEQLRGEPITTASDVYSLGLVLYELLTGQSPYRFKERSLTELTRVVCEEEALAPSTAIRTASRPADEGRAMDESFAPAQLRGDLDQIALTALRKDARMRYGSVEQLSEDLRRYLAGELISVRTTSRFYQTDKFIRRNKLGVGLALLLLLSLLGGFVTALWQARAARAQARLSRQLAYAGQMAMAVQSWELANPDRMQDLLERYLPRPGEEDLRGFEWYYLWRLNHRTGERQRLAHPQEVWGVAVSPDGRQFATACADGAARVYEAATGRPLRELRGHGQDVWTVAFSPDGRVLATGSLDKTAKLWDLASGRELATLADHGNRVGSLAFAPNGKTLATGSRDGSVKLWDVATGRKRLSLPPGVSWVNALAFSPDGNRLLAGRYDAPFLEAYDAATGHRLPIQFEHATTANAVAYSPDGTLIAAGGAPVPVSIWDARTGRLLHTLRGHTGEVRAIAFSPDGQLLASACFDRTVKLWRVSDGLELTTLKGHTSDVFSAAFAQDGRWLLSGSADRTARQWDLTIALEPDLLRGTGGRVARAALTANGDLIATTGSPGGTPGLWDAASLRLRRSLESPVGLNSYISVSPDSRMVAVGGADKRTRVWRVDTGELLATLQGHEQVVNALAFSPDARTLATTGRDNVTRLWDLATKREIRSLRGHEAQCMTLAYSPDGSRLATGSYDTTAKLWDLATGRVLQTFAGHANPILVLALSPDGRTLATGSADSLVKLWDVETGRLLRTITGHAGHVRALAFSPDGTRLATGGSEGLVRLWRIPDGQELVALHGHTDVINTLAFSRDGRLLISASADDTVRLWRTAPPQEVAAAGRP